MKGKRRLEFEDQKPDRNNAIYPTLYSHLLEDIKVKKR
jgi:hypothetical protein